KRGMSPICSRKKMRPRSISVLPTTSCPTPRRLTAGAGALSVLSISSMADLLRSPMYAWRVTVSGANRRIDGRHRRTERRARRPGASLAVLPAVEEEGRRLGVVRDVDHLPHDDHVVPGLVRGHDPAVEMGDRSFQDGGSGRPGSIGDVAERRL